MSVYSQPGVKTRYLFPHSFNSHAAEFKLDNHTAYYSNLRIARLGELRADAGQYNPMAGSYGILKNVSLTSNGKVIDSLREAHRYLAFTNLMNDNVHQACVLDREAKTNLGLVIDSSNSVVRAATGPSNVTTTNATAVDERNKFLGYLPLHRCFPVLANIAALDTDMFPNLTVRIEFETNPLFAYVSTTTTASQGQVEPVLICDEIRDPALRMQLQKSFQPVVWSSIEHDLVQIDSKITEANALGDTDSVKQEVNQKMLGFNDKYVSRIVFAKAEADLARNAVAGKAIGFGPYASYAGFNEVFNVRLNGSNLLPGRGIQNRNAALMLLSDTYGSFGMCPMDNQLSVGSESQAANNTRQAGLRDETSAASATAQDRQSEKVGQLSYYGMSLEDKVQDLQISFERTILKSTVDDKKQLSCGIALHAFAEVRKSLTMENGQMMVSYL